MIIHNVRDGRGVSLGEGGDEAKQFQKCFETVLFQLHFNVRAV